MPEPDPVVSGGPTSKPHWTVLSVALFAIGLLILIPSGLCTALGIISMATTDPSFLGIVLLFGGTPIVIGVGLVFVGLKVRRRD